MTNPREIRRKAENIYGELLRAWAAGTADDFFPRIVPADRKPHANLAEAARAVRELRDGSKERLGYGYMVEWEQVNSRRFGRNPFPRRIMFETAGDLLRLIEKQREFDAIVAAATAVRDAFPALGGWVGANLRTLPDLEPDLAGLIAVTRHLVAHPRPNCFARELPVPVDTKFVQRNRGVLRQWLDRLLPPHAVRPDEEHFERRFGLRYAEPDLFIRFLDPRLQARLCFPCPALALPLSTAAALEVGDAAVVVIVENKVNLLTLPTESGQIALGGLGHGIMLLQHLPWLRTASIFYWGDLDVDGFEILSSLRRLCPQTRSVLMDSRTLARHRPVAVCGNGRCPPVPANLTVAESAAFEQCASENIRIEQERLPAHVLCAPAALSMGT